MCPVERTIVEKIWVNFNQKSNNVVSVEITVDIEIKNTLLNTSI
jgi:hypothetical protein